MPTLTVRLKNPHPKQVNFINSAKPRIAIRAGRRGGKTVGVAIRSVKRFLAGRRILYACPTLDQVNTYWQEVKAALKEPIDAGIYYKNETEKIIERPGTKQRIKAKTAHNADTLRGDYADDLILDEYQDMNPDAWTLVGAPMLLDNQGDAIFIYTSKIGLKHIKALVDRCKTQPDRWELFSFSSYDNPHLPKEAIDDLADDMTSLAYRMEILAEEVEDDPSALWNRRMIDRVIQAPDLYRIVVAIDPPGGATEAGIIVAGVAVVGGQDHMFVLADYSEQMSAAEWAAKAVSAYHEWEADAIVAETNYGGDMVANTIATIDSNVPVEVVRASRGKAVRAEPVVAIYQNHAGFHRVHHVGELPGLEDEMCLALDTLVLTSRGNVPIQDVIVGDMVMTRKGFREVAWSGMTGYNRVFEIKTRKGRNLFATDSHPVYTIEKGFVPVKDLSIGDTLEVIWENTEIQSLGTGSDGMSTTGVTTWTERESYCTGQFGNQSMAQFLKDSLFTTKMRTDSIMPLRISNSSPGHGTPISTLAPTSPPRNEAPQLRRIGQSANQRSLFVQNVARSLNRSGSELSFVIEDVQKDTVAELTPNINTIPVYNLMIRDEPEYFANGILVHNCTWVPGQGSSPNRVDALVWAGFSLIVENDSIAIATARIHHR